MRKILSVFIVMVGFMANSVQANDNVTEESMNVARKVMKDSYNKLVTMDELKFDNAIRKFADKLAVRNPILAINLENMIESGKSKAEILADLKAKMDSISNHGLFLVGVAICHSVASFNGGWCFHTNKYGGYGYIPPISFILLTIVTLGETDSASDF